MNAGMPLKRPTTRETKRGVPRGHLRGISKTRCGHQLIISRVVERASAEGAVPTVITFDPHPRAVLHPESAPPLLQTFDQKIEAFGVLGVEQAIVIRFTRDFARVRAAEFLRDVVHERLHAKEVYLGRGFAFGRGREGDIELLRKASPFN